MFIFIVYLNDVYLFELIYIGHSLIFILYGDFIIIPFRYRKINTQLLKYVNLKVE